LCILYVDIIIKVALRLPKYLLYKQLGSHISVGTLENGYVRNILLPRIPQILGCQLLRNYSKVTVITVFWASDFGYCLFFKKSNHQNWREEPKSKVNVITIVLVHMYVHSRYLPRILPWPSTQKPAERERDDITHFTQVCESSPASYDTIIVDCHHHLIVVLVIVQYDR
jgi:hypothetical protein